MSPAILLLFALTGAEPRSLSVAQGYENGRLVVCIASKCEYDDGQPADVEGPSGLAALAHKYGFPVTYYMKPFTVEACRTLLKSWHDQYGDEVGWLSDGTPFGKAEAELARMRQLAEWQSITTAGNLRFGLDWSNFYLRQGIQSVWGRCYEQSYTDGITDRGCPPGFYYALPACFRSPNQTDGGLISVPWLSNDLNLVFRTAQQSTFTFDPNDSQSLHVSTPDDDSFWKAELDQYQKQTRYNKTVPLVVQQETGKFHLQGASPFYVKWRKDGRAILENLFKVLKDRHITVVNVSQAVQIYKQAYSASTPPTYNIFDNISSLPIIQKCPSFKMVAERFTGTKKLAKFNGYYACASEGGKALYFSPDGKTFYDRGRNLTYFDRSGLLVFDDGNPLPIRITSYLNDPARYMKGILPELSYLFDTAKYIPKADVHTSKNGGHLQVAVKVALECLPDYMGDRLPYGVMLWGNYSAWKVPAGSPAGTKILDSHGLFVPMLLKPGVNTLELSLPAKSEKPTVFELNVEKFRHDQLVAAAALQGLANRDAPQVFLQTVDADWMITFKHNGIVHSPEILKKYRSVDDAWKDYYSTKHGLHFETLPTLEALATKAGSAVHGVILYDPRNPGEVPVAITLAGLRDAVPVTEAVRKECPALAALPVLEDIRGRFADRVAAQRWAIRELLPQCSQDGAFSYTGGIDAMSLDIAVARKMFVYQLAHLSPNVVPNAKERAIRET